MANYGLAWLLGVPVSAIVELYLVSLIASKP